MNSRLSKSSIILTTVLATMAFAGVPAWAGPHDSQTLTKGFNLERALGPGENHVYTIVLADGEAITGSAEQHAVDLVIDIFDPAGAKIATVDTQPGLEGPEPFDVSALKAGEYRLVVRTANRDVKPGRYVMKVDRIFTIAENGRRQAERNYPPLLLKLWEAYQTDPDAPKKFYESRRGKGPIIEKIPGEGNNYHVTYLFYGDENTKAVSTAGGPHRSISGIDLTRFMHTPLFFGEEDMPGDSRFSYGYEAIQERFVGPGGSVQMLDDRLGIDDLNPVQYAGLSVLTLPAAPPQTYMVPNPSAPAGKLTQAHLKSAALYEDRTFTVYTPPGYDGKQACDLVILFDGLNYGGGTPNQTLVPAPTILDNLIAANKIRPTIGVMVNNMGHRNRDLFCYRPYADFIGTELVPWARKNYKINSGADHVVAAGSSAGGLASSYVAFCHPESIGNVLSQSGSYWQQKDWQKPVLPWPVVTDSGDLLLEFKKSKRLPIKFYMEIGRFDSLGQMLGTNRELRDVLELKGYSLTYREFDSGHDYIQWRESLADGLIALIGRR